MNQFETLELEYQYRGRASYVPSLSRRLLRPGFFLPLAAVRSSGRSVLPRFSGSLSDNHQASLADLENRVNQEPCQ